MWTLRFIGLIYGLSAYWCVSHHEETTRFLGLALTSPLAVNEYFSVYGGLQAGLALAMILSSLQKTMIPAALFFSLVVSMCLVVFRVGALVLNGYVPDALFLVVLEGVIAGVLLLSWYFNDREGCT